MARELPLPKQKRLRTPDGYLPETLAKVLKRTAGNLLKRRPVGAHNVGPYRNGLNIPHDLEEWRGRAIARPFRPSGKGELEDVRPDDVSEEPVWQG